MKFIAQHRTSKQISPDDWEVYSRTMEVTEKTTIGEIREWYKKQNGDSSMEVKLIELTK